MKKLYVLASTLMLASLVLSACGGTPATEAPVVTEAPAMTEAPMATEAPAMTEAPVQQDSLAAVWSAATSRCQPIPIMHLNPSSTQKAHALLTPSVRMTC